MLECHSRDCGGTVLTEVPPVAAAENEIADGARPAAARRSEGGLNVEVLDRIRDRARASAE